MAAEWSHDFCLSCDKQIAEGAYCSQSCRLADLDKATADTSSILAASYSSSTASSSYSSSASAGHSAFFLPPAVNFNSYRSTRPESPPTSPAYTSNRSYFPHHSSKQSTSSTSSTSSDASKRTLSPSSSRSSLMSLTGSAAQGPGQQGLSTQAANELRGYASSFDRVRDYKRRMPGA